MIVPARNEEACLARCLESLVAQAGIDFEIVVVDDASTDRTAEIARSFATSDKNCLTLISAPPLPDNWTGKNNAMSAGAKIATGKWLLFTDADTFHKPGSLSRAVAEAEEHRIALLSYSPEQEVRTFWERAVMPVIFAELAATYPPKEVNDPASPIAAANGQYLMISRDAYDAVGGHTKIASDLLEDVAMARLLKSSGHMIFFRYGGDAVRTRMYRSWSQMKEGWTKNLALLFRGPSRMAFRYGAEFLLLLAAVCGLIENLLCGSAPIPSQRVLLPHSSIPNALCPSFRWWMTGSLIVLAFVVFKNIRRIQKGHFPYRYLIPSMLGSAVFAYLLLRSSLSLGNRSVTWKGRTYQNLEKGRGVESVVS